MTRERLMELISAEADEALTDTEQAELERLLAEYPEGRRYRADLARLESVLGEAAEPEIPVTLRASIMSRAVRGARPPATRRAGLRMPGPLPVLRYGLAGAAGMLLAVAWFGNQPAHNGAPNLDELVGTITSHRSRAGAEELGAYRLRTQGVESDVRLLRRDGALLLDIRIAADRPIDLRVNLAGAGVRLDAVAQDEGPVDFIQFADEELHVRGLGERRLIAVLHRTDDKVVAGGGRIELDYSSGGKLLQQGSLKPAW